MTADAMPAADVQPKAKIFVSYSRKDMAFADRLEVALTAHGFDVLIDRQEIYAFEDWWKRIEALIGRADTVVFILSPDAVRSDVALKEVAYAASLNKRFAPIVCRPVEDGAVPEALRHLNFIFFDNPERFDASANALVDALETDIGWIRQHTDYGEAERRWSSAGRPNGLLLQSPTLELAEYWRTSRPRNAPEPTQAIQSYVLASRKQARTSQRIRRIAQTSIVTLLVGIILGLVGWINQDYIKSQWRWYTVTRPYIVAHVRPYVMSIAKEQALKPGDSFKECAQNCPEMIVIPAGEFTMGSAKEEKGSYDDERPQHTVAFARSFAAAKFDVTFDDWDACVAYGDCDPEITDSDFGRGRQPAINVSWDDAQRYVAWLSKMTSKPYRLLTEAEWEYAARARTQTAYSFGDDPTLLSQYAWGGFNSGLRPHPVGEKKPNSFGLYDMHGNVWQWTEDCFHGGYRIRQGGVITEAPSDGSAWTTGDCYRRTIRGGSWDMGPENVRSALRIAGARGSRDNTTGFRVARTLDTP